MQLGATSIHDELKAKRRAKLSGYICFAATFGGGLIYRMSIPGGVIGILSGIIFIFALMAISIIMGLLALRYCRYQLLWVVPEVLFIVIAIIVVYSDISRAMERI